MDGREEDPEIDTLCRGESILFSPLFDELLHLFSAETYRKLFALPHRVCRALGYIRQ